MRDGHLVIERARWLRGRESRINEGSVGERVCAYLHEDVPKLYEEDAEAITRANDLGPDEGREDRVARALLENVPGLRTVSFRGEDG